VLLSGIIATIVIYVRTRDEVDELFDRQLKQIALSLREQEDLSVTKPETPYDQEEERISVSAWDRAGVPVFGLAKGRPVPPSGSDGYSTVRWDGQPWRVYVGAGSGGTVEVAQPIAARATIALRIVARILMPTIPITVALIILVWVTVRQGLKPLAEVTGDGTECRIRVEQPQDQEEDGQRNNCACHRQASSFPEPRPEPGTRR
jgi:two-component system OmpR family sensor kinase